MIQRTGQDDSVDSPKSADAASFDRGPRSLLRVLNIFENLVKAAEGMTLTELSQALEAPKSSLLSLLRPLVASEYLVHSGSRYGLGPAIVHLSMNVLAGRSYVSFARVFLQELADETNESIYLTAIDRDHRIVTYVDAIESRQAVRYAVGVGAIRPLFVSAAGRVLLAYQDPEWIESFLASGPFKSPVTGELVEADQLRKDLQRIREEGCAVSLSQAVDGAAGIAAPIVDATGRATHALLVAAPLDRMLNSLPRMREHLIDVAGRASATLTNARTYR